jgi:hypothetical protein
MDTMALPGNGDVDSPPSAPSHTPLTLCAATYEVSNLHTRRL